MKFWRGVMVVLVLLSSQSVFAATLADPMWMFADTSAQTTHSLIFNYFRYCDTNRTLDVLCSALESDQLPDTGNSYDGSTYINFPYQFSTNPVIVYDAFDPSVITYQDNPRPGFAGFKTAWDYGMTGFPLPRYKYLIFAHLGPLPNHKVTVHAWYNDGNCGSPSYPDYLGTFTSSTTWRVDTIVIPDSLRSRSDVAKNYKYFELVMVINNANPSDTNKTSAPGLLKMDNIRLAGLDLPVTPTTPPATKKSGCGGGFAIAFIPPIWFKARAMLRRKKRNGSPS